MQHRYNRDSPQVPATFPSIIDASSFLKRDYRTNNPYSFDTKSNPHNPQQQCDYLYSTKTALTV